MTKMHCMRTTVISLTVFLIRMETLYTGHIHALHASHAGSHGNNNNVTMHTLGTPWTTQGGLVALGVVLGSSISLVGLAFSFITYSLFSDLRSLAGTALLSLLASLFMGQLLFVIGVGGVQDTELCISISLALLFMKLAALCWLCCCCHHALSLYRSSANLIFRPEPKMGQALAQYSLLSWGFSLIMVGVAAAFKYEEHEHDHRLHLADPLIVTALNPNNNCWLMRGPAYTWGFLAPAIVLHCTGFYLACSAKNIAKVSAGMQVDARVRSKLAKRRSLQTNLFLRLLVLFTVISICGAIASIWDVPMFWSFYSIGQGLQGIVTTLLVTCNCKVLKLYTTPRLHKSRKDNKYAELQDGFGPESSRYAVLSVSNPNYSDTEVPTTDGAFGGFDEPDDGLDDRDAESGMVKVAYKEDSMCGAPCVEHSVDRPPLNRFSGVFDRMVLDAVPVKDVLGGPIPASV